MPGAFTIRLRTAPTRSFRVLNTIWRVLIIFLGAIGLGLEASIINSVYDQRFPSRRSEMSTLPAGGLGINILWNIVAFATMTRVMPCLHTIGDLLALVSLIVLGYTGFQYDNVHYLKNGAWRYYDTPSFLPIEIAAAVFMIIVCILQLGLVLFTPLTFVRDAERAEINDYEIEAPADDGMPAYYERDEAPISPSKASFDSTTKANFKQQ